MMLLGYLVPRWLVQGVLSVVAVVGGFGFWLMRHDAKVVKKEQVRVETKGAITHGQAEAARRAVPVNGSPERLRNSANCRDC